MLVGCYRTFAKAEEKAKYDTARIQKIEVE